MTTAEFIAYLHTLDIRLSINGERLRCSAPKGALTDQIRAELTARKADLLAWVRAHANNQESLTETLAPHEDPKARLGIQHHVQNRHSLTSGGSAERLVDESTAVRPAPTRRRREGDLPLSFAQQRLWFLAQLEPHSAAYVLTAWQRFPGPLDLTALANAFTELVRRHEALRTTFVSKDGDPVQRIAAPKPIAPEIIDLTSVPQTARLEAVRQTIQEQAGRGFDLTRGPLFRSVLIRLGPDDHELLVLVHHIIADGWSVNLLIKELTAFYEAERTGHPARLLEPPLQYADFAVWQQQWLTDAVLDPQRRYWLAQLNGSPTTLNLPRDHARSHQSPTAGASYQFTFPPALADCLRNLSLQAGATLFMTLLAAFKALLARYTDQEDIVVGCPVANRHSVELESVVGLFANTLVLRTSLDGDPTFRELLVRVRETCLGAYAHPDMPFEKLVEELQPKRILGQNPLFQVSFVWESAATGADVAFLTLATPFDLSLFVRDRHDGMLSATIQYKRDLFEPETIARFAHHYCTLLQRAASDPNCRLAALPLLTEDEAHQLLIAYNATTTPYPRDRSIPRLFEDQVDLTPDAVAIVADGVSLTYRELEQRTNRLARYLRMCGVGPEQIVGVWMERSVDAIVALLGILKAGGAYAPFDLLAPPERLARMLRDAEVDLVLTHERMRASLPAQGPRAVCLDTPDSVLWSQADSRLAAPVSADGLAYVMYTSGSTGEPKGVAVTQRNVVRLVKNTNYAHLGSNEVFLQLAALSFDAATFEIWGVLLNGGRLVIAPPGVLSLADLGAVIARHGVTTLWLTAGLFHQIVDQYIELLRPLRQLLTGGDVLSPAHVKRMLATVPGCRLINGYGPTEGTTFTCCHTITETTLGEHTVPIGHPIANTRVYVLDRFLRPVPLGVPGELWVAGDGLARGYVRRPELTAERFVAHRFSDTLEERLYQTGDRVRRLHGGTIEFLGRLDSQVKVRGYRVEPGEIEATVRRHPRVREAAVVAHRTAEGDKRLIAYVVAHGSWSARDCRDFLVRQLPDYMIPAAFVMLEHLPLTTNGKIDRQALPEPEARAETSDCPPVEPRDELEWQLVQIWQDVLSVSPIGIHHNFFDLGGHSLLAVRMVARLEAQLQVTVPLVTLFRAPTIGELAALIRSEARPTLGRSLVLIQPHGSRPPVFGMPGVQGTVFIYKALAQLLGPDQAFYGLQSRGLDGVEKPLTRIEDIAAEFLREIRTVQSEGPYYLLGMCMGGVVAYEMAQQLRSAGQAVALLVLLETWSPETTSVRRLKLGGRGVVGIKFVLDHLRCSLATLARLRGREQFRYLLGRVQLFTEILRQRDLFREARGEFHLEVVTRANLLAFQQYKPRVYPGPAVLFCAEGRTVDPAVDSRLAWRELVTGGLEVYSAPGANSGLMLMEPHVQAVATQLKTCLDHAQELPSLARRHEI